MSNDIGNGRNGGFGFRSCPLFVIKMTAKPVLFKRKAKVITISVNKKLGIILKTTTSVIVALVVLLAFLLVGVRLFGLQVYTVLSGSMEPDYPTGSLIYVREIDPAELEVRDVITFKLSGGTTATHRIVELVPDENDPDIMRFRTKGDANDTADGSLVEADSVIGTPVFVLPYLGYLASFIRNPPGMYIAIAIGIALGILVMIADMILDDEKAVRRKAKVK